MERRKRVLVVDDEAPIRRVLEMKLRNGGYDVLLAEDGEAALAMIGEARPDALIVDINMPRMNGRELCEAIEPLKKERPFLTIVMTARIIPDEERWMATLQQTQFLEKPFSPAAILERIDRYCEVTR